MLRFRQSRRKPRATIDFETRSVCDIKRRGAYLYSIHPTTQILCMAYRVPGGELKLWHRAHPALGIAESPAPTDLFEWIAAGGLVEAHNSGFERYIWQNVGTPQHGWPAVDDSQWRCSAAKAAAVSLPRDLGRACVALGLAERKDERGKELIRLFCMPKRLTKKEREEFGEDAVRFREDGRLVELWAYCLQDVRAEEALSEALPDLSPMELRVWQITERMNGRGVLLDRELCEAALELAAKATAKATDEFRDLTGIASPGQRAQISAWLAERGVNLPDTTAQTIQWALDRKRDEMPDHCARVLEIVKEVNRTSTKKFVRMLENMDDANRARELLLYCGAERTGRYAGKGIQVQNLPKGKFSKHLPKKTAIDIAVADVKTRDLDWCEVMHGDVMQLLASCLRGAIIAPAGREIVVADYAAIEARCVLWESGATKALEVFTRGEDIYCDMASGIYGRPITKATAKPINNMGATERDFGKVAVLGLGYGMGFLKFLVTLRTYNIVLPRAQVLEMMGEERFETYEAKVRRALFPELSDFPDGPDGARRFTLAKRAASKACRALTDAREDPRKVMHELALCKYTVDTYRSRYSEVPQMWKDQEAAAIRATQTGEEVPCGPVTWKKVGRFLKCRLPSGRCLNYFDAYVEPSLTAWGETRPTLKFYGIDQTTKQWTRQATYGGKIVENITQAIARDVMAYAKLAVDDHPLYDLLISVHDELLAEAPEGEGSVNEFERLLEEHLPPSYAGCPIKAEGAIFKRYRK